MLIPQAPAAIATIVLLFQIAKLAEPVSVQFQGGQSNQGEQGVHAEHDQERSGDKG